MATASNANSSTKVIRIQDEEKELLFRLREIYGNDYKKYGEYIRREPDVPISIKKIYKLLDERKAYRRISDYFHRERAAKKAKDPPSNGLGVNYTRTSTRGITQVPEQISSPLGDHEMEDDEDLDDENHPVSDHHQGSVESPTGTNISDDLLDRSHRMHDDELQLSSNHQRKRVFPSGNCRTSTDGPILSGKTNLLSVRSHLEKALHELDRAIISKDDLADDEQMNVRTRANYLMNGHRHSKLDDIVRSLSNVVNQQQENTRLIIDQSSLLLSDDGQQLEDKQSFRLPNDSQESLKNILDRLNALVDRGNSIYDRVESILSEF